MVKKKDICEECGGEFGEDGICQDCGCVKEEADATEIKGETAESDSTDDESDEDEEKEDDF
jgi:hypothetical protein